MAEDTSFGNIFDLSIKTLKSKGKLLFSLFIVLGIPSFIVNLYSNLRPLRLDSPDLPFRFLNFSMFSILSTLVAMLAVTSALYVLFKSPRETSLLGAIKGGLKYYLRYLLFFIIVVFLTTLLSIFFVIPGIVYMVNRIFSMFIIVDQDATVGESFKKSKQLVKGNWWRTLGKLLLLYIILYGIGFIFIVIFSFFGVVLSSIISSLVFTIISVITVVFLANLYNVQKYKSRK